jgi:hypothetical protein
LYFTVIAYVATRKREVILIAGIFIFSMILEAYRLGDGQYKLEANDLLWTTRDIVWTIMTIVVLQYIKQTFPYAHKHLKKKKKA